MDGREIKVYGVTVEVPSGSSVTVSSFPDLGDSTRLDPPSILDTAQGRRGHMVGVSDPFLGERGRQ